MAFAAIFVSSCTKELAPAGNGEKEITEISASYASVETKTILGEDGTSALWSPNDEINVFFNTVGVKFTSLNTTPIDKTVFASSQALFYSYTESGAETEGPYFWGVYPYSEENTSDGESVTMSVPFEQSALCNSFDRGSFAAIGRSKDTKIAFYNLCGGVRFSLVNEGIKTVTISGNNDEVLAGKVKVVFDENGKPKVSEVIQGQKTITLNAPEGGEFETGKWYYISVLPVEFSTGFSIKFDKGTSAGVEKTTSSQKVKRSIFGEIKEVDKNVKFVPTEDPTSETATLTYAEAKGNYSYNNPVNFTNAGGAWDICCYSNNNNDTAFQLNSSTSSKNRLSFIGTPVFSKQIITVKIVSTSSYEDNIYICYAASEDSSVILMTVEGQGTVTTIDVSELELNKLYIRSNRVFNIKEVSVEIGTPKPAEDTPFTRTMVPGFYSNTSTTPQSSLLIEEQEQFSYGKSSEGRILAVADFSTGMYKFFSVAATSLTTGTQYSAELDENGSKTSFAGLTCVKKTYSQVWLEDKVQNLGFIIPIE